jgi:Ca-activated chloride channel homolog
LEFNTLKPLLLLILLLPMAWAFRQSLVNRPKWLKIGAFALRCLGVILLILALCRPFWKSSSGKKHVAYMVDISDSVSLKAAGEATKNIKKSIKELKNGDSWELFAFGREFKQISPEALQKKIKDFQNNKANPESRQETRLADALRGAAMTFPSDKQKQIVLFSDGVSTQKGVKIAMNAFSKQQRGKLIFKKIGGIDSPEAAVLDFTSTSKVVYPGETARFTVRALANRDMPARIRFINKSIVMRSVPVKLEKNKILKLVVNFSLTAKSGSVWQAEIIPEKDYFPENNSAVCSVRVKSKSKVLALHLKPRKLKTFQRAMRQQGINVEVRGRYGFPGSLRELLAYDAVILADFPADLMSMEQMNVLKSFVRDLGRGLIMCGSENSFGLGGYYKTPIEEVLPSVSRYEKQKEQPSLSMVLVIDKSGSMGGMPIVLARQAANAAVELLGVRDRIGVIAFDGQPYNVVELTSAVDKESIKSKISTIAAGGGTNLYPAMVAGSKMLESSGTRLKHMIVLSDGQSMPGDFDGIATQMADNGVTLSTVALGSGAHQQLMKRLAEIGKGRCYITQDAESMPRIFARETVKASRSAIKEQPFSVTKIASASFLDDIDFEKAPYLLGYVMTRVKPTATTLLIGESGTPLLTMGRFGLGRSFCFTSGISSEWAGEWMEWQHFGKFWSQILRFATRPPESDKIRVKTLKQGRNVELTINRYGERDEALSGVKWQAELLDASGLRTPVTVQEAGYGKYSASVKLPENISSSLLLKDPVSNLTKLVHFDFSYPAEYRLVKGVNEALSNINANTTNSLLTRISLFTLFTVAGLLSLISGILFRRI